MCTLWSACTECAVMNRNAMPCLAMPCLALPCLATYVYIYIYTYIVWCRGGVCKLQFLYCFSSPRAGCSAWHLRPSTLCGERSEHGWRPLFLGQRSLACFADCKWFSIRAHFRIIWKHLFMLSNVFSFKNMQWSWLFCTSDCSKASWTTWTWGLRTWCCDLVPLDMRLYSNRQTT